MIHTGDCLDVMAGMEPESVDAIVTDPPYGLGFMGKAWDNPGQGADVPMRRRSELDAVNAGMSRQGGRQWRGEDGQKRQARDMRTYQEWSQSWAEAAYRVAKPSSYLLAFGGTRTVHRMTVALEDAGWIIRDMLVWAYASGFPKSKASLKPAWEPIVMARKPGPLRMLAIDACRIGTEPVYIAGGGGSFDADGNKTPLPSGRVDEWRSGRWPANVILTDPIFDGGVEGVVGGGEAGGGFGIRGKAQPNPNRKNKHDDWGMVNDRFEVGQVVGFGDSGTYSRFFLIPKADRADREPVLGGLPERAYEAGAAHKRCATCGKQEVNVPGSECQCAEPVWVRPETTRTRANVHPTVKPVDLMRHLVRLVTPTGGTVLDPFLGSGTTALACEMEGFGWVGIEREAEYVAIAEARLNGVQRGLGLESA